MYDNKEIIAAKAAIKPLNVNFCVSLIFVEANLVHLAPDPLEDHHKIKSVFS